MPGEYADMMLDGDMCEGCGEWMGSPGEGFPRRCAACAQPPEPEPRRAVMPIRFFCPVCGKKCGSVQGIHDHASAKHWWLRITVSVEVSDA